MDPASLLVRLAWDVKRNFERLSVNDGETVQTLKRLDSVTSLCRLIVASGEKRLWEGLQDDISTLRGAVERAGAIAEEALPHASDKGWLRRAWRGVVLFANAATIGDHLRAANAHLDQGVSALTAKLAVKTSANMSDVLLALKRVEAKLGEGKLRGADVAGADVAFIAEAFRIDVEALGATLQRDFDAMQHAIATVDSNVRVVDQHVLDLAAQMRAMEQRFERLLREERGGGAPAAGAHVARIPIEHEAEAARARKAEAARAREVEAARAREAEAARAREAEIARARLAEAALAREAGAFSPTGTVACSACSLFNSAQALKCTLCATDLCAAPRQPIGDAVDAGRLGRLVELTGGRGPKGVRVAALRARGEDYTAICAKAVAEGAIPTLVGALKARSGDAVMCADACVALRNITAAGEGQARSVASAGAIPALVAALTGHARLEAVCAPACGALQNIAYSPDLCASVVEAGGVRALTAAAAAHAGAKAVAEEALARLKRSVQASGGVGGGGGGSGGGGGGPPSAVFEPNSYHEQQLRPYTVKYRFFTISEAGHSDAWDMYREIFPGGFFGSVAKPGSIAAPAPAVPERTAVDAFAISIAEAAGSNATNFFTCAFPTRRPTTPKASDAHVNLQELCTKWYTDSVERAGYAGSPTHVALIMLSPRGKRCICFVDVSKQ